MVGVVMIIMGILHGNTDGVVSEGYADSADSDKNDDDATDDCNDDDATDDSDPCCSRQHLEDRPGVAGAQH